MVGHETLDLVIVVRIHTSQPMSGAGSPAKGYL